MGKLFNIKKYTTDAESSTDAEASTLSGIIKKKMRDQTKAYYIFHTEYQMQFAKAEQQE